MRERAEECAAGERRAETSDTNGAVGSAEREGEACAMARGRVRLRARLRDRERSDCMRRPRKSLKDERRRTHAMTRHSRVDRPSDSSALESLAPVRVGHGRGRGHGLGLRLERGREAWSCWAHALGGRCARVRTLVLHGAHVEVVDGDNVVDVEV
eukprot:1116440-Pleurochrysis_carterae.AAC.1